MRPLPAVLTLCIVALAGCVIEPQDNETATQSPASSPAASGTSGTPAPTPTGSIDGDIATEESAQVCAGGLQFPPNPEPDYCATRTHTLRGDVSLTTLPAFLRTFNGQVTIGGGAPGAWQVVVTITARDSGEAAARARLDEVTFTWALTDAEGPHLIASAVRNSGQGGSLGARIEATLPRNVVYDLEARSSNGNLDITGLTFDALRADTSNGGVTADVTATEARLGTSNGDIDATVRPRDDGLIDLDTSNGRIDLALPEGPDIGYDLEASTSNGQVRIELDDGQTSQSSQTRASFQSTNLHQRQHQVQVGADTSNGDVTVTPA